MKIFVACGIVYMLKAKDMDVVDLDQVMEAAVKAQEELLEVKELVNVLFLVYEQLAVTSNDGKFEVSRDLKNPVGYVLE